MKKKINVFEFMDGFRNEKGELEGWTYEGLEALYNYFLNLEENIGEEIEFDPIAIAIDYTQYNSIEKFLNDYGDTIKTKREDYEDEDEYIEALEKEIREKTELIKIRDDLRNGFIIQNW